MYCWKHKTKWYIAVPEWLNYKSVSVEVHITSWGFLFILNHELMSFQSFLSRFLTKAQCDWLWICCPKSIVVGMWETSMSIPNELWARVQFFINHHSNLCIYISVFAVLKTFYKTHLLVVSAFPIYHLRISGRLRRRIFCRLVRRLFRRLVRIIIPEAYYRPLCFSHAFFVSMINETHTISAEYFCSAMNCRESMFIKKEAIEVPLEFKSEWVCVTYGLNTPRVRHHYVEDSLRIIRHDQEWVRTDSLLYNWVVCSVHVSSLHSPRMARHHMALGKSCDWAMIRVSWPHAIDPTPICVETLASYENALMAPCSLREMNQLALKGRGIWILAAEQLMHRKKFKFHLFEIETFEW